MPIKRWNTAVVDEAAAQDIAARFGIPELAAGLLVTRGITQPELIAKLIAPATQPLSDPMGYIDMDKAVARVKKAIEQFELIAVFGDYDVDGVTATALLYSYLSSSGANVIYLLPSRDEGGYGLNCSIVDNMHQLGVRLIITVDNGILANNELAYAADLGIETVVTDHHSPSDMLPECCAVVNPHRKDCISEYKHFAGVGVAFKLVCALEGESDSVLERYADLIALGTVADVVPLTDENRTLVVRGLEKMKTDPSSGVKMLMAVSGVNDKAITSSDIAFILSPRINSAGRMGKPDRAVKLLLGDDLEEQRLLAQELQSENERRKDIEHTIFDEAWRQLEKQPELINRRVVVICGEGWHDGVVGIFAARLCEQLGKPCIVLSSNGETARGSGRCFGDFSLFEALTNCSDILTTYGGHKSAAGMTMQADRVDEFRERINAFAARLEKMPEPVLDIDCEVSPNRLNLSLLEDTCCIQPFGAENPAPVMSVCGAVVKDIVPVGGGKHHRLLLERDGVPFTAMYFGMAKECFAFIIGDTVDIVFDAKVNEFRGSRSLTIMIREMRLSGTDVGVINSGEWLFDKLMLGEQLTAREAQSLLPEREQFAAVYKYLYPNGYCGSLDILCTRLSKYLNYGTLLTVLEVFARCGLLKLRRRGQIYTIRLLESKGKVDLNEDSLMKRLGQAIV